MLQKNLFFFFCKVVEMTVMIRDGESLVVSLERAHYSAQSHVSLGLREQGRCGTPPPPTPVLGYRRESKHRSFDGGCVCVCVSSWSVPWICKRARLLFNGGACPSSTLVEEKRNVRQVNPRVLWDATLLTGKQLRNLGLNVPGLK